MNRGGGKAAFSPSIGNAQIAQALSRHAGSVWLRNSNLRHTTSMPPTPARPPRPAGTPTRDWRPVWLTAFLHPIRPARCNRRHRNMTAAKRERRLEYGSDDVSVEQRQAIYSTHRDGLVLKAPKMNQEFNRAANDSPRSGSSKRVTPMIWGAIVLTFVVVAIWLATNW